MTRTELEHRLLKLYDKKIDDKLSMEEIDEMYHIQDLLNERHDEGQEDYYEEEEDEEEED